MSESVYITEFDGEKVEVYLAEMNEAKYTVIIVREFNKGPSISFPTVYLPKAPRDENEVFLKTYRAQSQAINDLLEREGLVELQNQVIETKDGYAQVAKLTDKAIQIRDGYITKDTDGPDKLPDSEFD